MANDKNFFKKLVLELDDDGATQIHEISQLRALTEAADEFEDDDTVQFDAPDFGDAESGERIAELEAELAERDKALVELRRQVDGEVRGRDRQSEQLQSDLHLAEDKISRREASLKEARAKLLDEKQELASVKAELRQAQSTLESLKTAEKEAQASADALETRVREAEERAESSESHAREAEKRAASLERDAREAESRAQESDNDEVKRLRTELDKANEQVHDVESENARLQADLAARQTVAARQELEAASPALNVSAGRYAAALQDIKDLRSQIARTESYCDEMRRKLTQQQDSKDEKRSTHENLSNSLETAQQELTELQTALEKERTERAEVAGQLEELKKSFEEELQDARVSHNQDLEENQRKLEDELRQLRFELTTAEETISDHEATNEQLTANLLNKQNTSQTLEEQLSGIETKHDDQKHDLERQLRKLEIENEELGRKLENKDSAIAGLMSELAGRGDDAADGEHRKADAKPSPAEEHPFVDPADPKPRVSRLLIGKLDGQELRFPLFKDRLTIGRTPDNDIQLDTRFISRRHAVIFTEGNSTRIVDWGSKNGIHVNKQAVKEKVLSSGDIVTIGTADFRFEERGRQQ